MNETMLQYWERLKQYWNRFGRKEKITIVATVLLLALAIGIVSYKMSKTEYETAFTELPPNEAAAIKDYLKSNNIPYVLSADGKSIGVPRNEVTNVRLDVVSQGLDKSGSIGYGAFSNTSTFGMTDKEFDVKYLDAVQGELQQMINHIVAVADSKVLINLAQESVFVRDAAKDNQSTASVVLELKPGYQLDQQQIDTMYMLVSKSIKNLPIDNITISDQLGDLLPYSKNSGSTINSANVASQMQIKRELEQDIYTKVVKILGGVLGPGKVIPMVVATLNFDSKHTKSDTVTPVNTVDNKGIEISVQRIQESYTGDAAANGGVAGTGQTDVPTYPATTGTGKSNSEKTQETINYEVNRIHQEVDSSPYTVTDLAISVGIEPPDPKDPNSLSQQTKDAIQKLLVNVVSASLANSGKTFTATDLAQKVVVFEQPFYTKPIAAQANNTNWYLYGGLGAVALLLAAAGGYFVSRRRRQQQLLEEEAAAEPVQPELPTIDLENVTNENQMRKQLESLAKKKPQEFVNLLRTWLVDE